MSNHRVLPFEHHTGPPGVIRYGGVEIEAPAEVLEDLADVMVGIERLRGSHVFLLECEVDRVVTVWLTPGVPLVLEFPQGWDPSRERPNYIDVLEASRRQQMWGGRNR